MNRDTLASWKVLVPVALGLALLGWIAWQVYRGMRLAWALTLPVNHQLALHLVEVGLLVFLGLYFLGAAFGRAGRPLLLVRTEKGREKALTELIEVGSGEDCDLVLQGAPVSRRHLRLRSTPEGHCEVMDPGSTNGTFLGGRDLRGSGWVGINPGDVLTLGHRGPELTLEARPVRGRWGPAAALLGLVAFLGLGLYLGWRANLDRLPEVPMVLGQVAVDFTPFRDGTPVLVLGLVSAILLISLVWSVRERPVTALATLALGLFFAIGLVLLYALLPAAGLRYGNAAQRAYQDVGPASWKVLEQYEKDGREPRDLLTGGLGAVELGENLSEDQKERLVRSYIRGRSALVWATNLGARKDAPIFSVTYFRQSAILLVAFALFLVLPQRWPLLRTWMGRFPAALSRPISRSLVRSADRGASWARILRPVAYWDVACGLLAAVVVAVTLWTPLGTTLGRGKSLYLDLPGLPTIQSVEVVKALFVLFMTGYFARHGGVLAKAPRGRYVVPYLLAALLTLALTGVQADLGGLFMLALFLSLVFIAATGSLRLVATVPLMLFPAVFLAWWLGLTSIVETRLGIWFEPREHALGEQVVQARQIFLSSGWEGYSALRSMAWRLPDVQGDLVIAAFAERYGGLGLLALVAAWLAFGRALLLRAQRADRAGSILLASVAALVLVQVLTQVGGALGLLPLTGVPLPWISHGLTAALVFTALAALALGSATPETAAAASGSQPPRALPALRSVSYLHWANGAACAAMALLALGWTVVLPARGEVGDLGRDYRWKDLSRSREVEAYIQAGLFQQIGTSRRAELNREVYEAYREGGGEDPGLLQLIDMASDLVVTAEGKVRPRDYLVMNPNPFADRGGSRGTVLSADGIPLALTDDRGRRHYFLGEAAFHPVGYGGGAAQPQGFEAAASGLLRGRNLGASLREQAFLLDIHHGPEVELTLMTEVQRQAYGALEGHAGAAVVLDLSNGDLLALASAPSVDPTGAGVSDWRNWLRAGEPLRNRAIESPAGYSPPGSVFKLAVAAALLEGSGEGQRVTCRGYDDELRVSCAHGKVHGRIGLETALEASCNIYFARKAVALGQEPLRSMATQLGFNGGEGVLLTPGLPKVSMRSGISTVLSGGEVLRDRDLARVGYGQGPVSVTVFDIARMGAAIAGGGSFHEPRLTRAYGFSTEAENGERDRSTLRELPIADQRQVLPRSAAVKLREYSRKVFSGTQGTARSLERLWWGPEGYELAARSPGEEYVEVPVAGKTGSAWRSRYDTMDDAWMLAWAPAEEPRVLVSVMLQDAGEGGKVAGPVAMDLLRTALQALQEREAWE